MHPITRAFARESWRQTKYLIYLVPCVAAGFACWVAFAAVRHGNDRSFLDNQQHLLAYIVVQLFNLAAASAFANGTPASAEGQGRSQYLSFLYTLPISAERFVYTQLSLFLSMFAALYGFAAALFAPFSPMNLAGAVWGFLLGVTFFSILLAARDTSLNTSRNKKTADEWGLFWIPVIFILFAFQAIMHIPGMPALIHYYASIPVLVLIIIVANPMAVYLVKMRRRGEVLLPSFRPFHRLRLWVHPLPDMEPFPSIKHAQHWFEQRTMVFSTLVVAILSMAFTFLVYSLQSEFKSFIASNDPYLSAIRVAVWAPTLFALFVGIFVAQNAIGPTSIAENQKSPRSFYLYLPFTNRAWSNCIHRIIFANTLKIYIACTVAVFLGMGVLGDFRGNLHMHQVWLELAKTLLRPETWLGITLPMLVTWALMGMGATLALAGGNWSTGVVGLGVLVMLIFAITMRALPSGLDELAMQAYLLLLSAGIIIGNAILYRAARARRYVDRWTGIALWGILPLLLMISFFLTHREGFIHLIGSPFGPFLLYAITSLPMLPMSAIPLAIAKNRHR